MMPNLSAASQVAIDLETRDNGFAKENGPGWPTNDGYVVGVGVAVDGDSWYFPIRHEGGDNLDPDLVLRWTADLCSRDSDKFFHNASYDVGWLGAEDIKVNGKIHDTMYMASLLDEERRSYSLDNVCIEEGLHGKDETLLREAAAAYGVDPKAGLWRLPGRLVGPYGAQDAAATLALAGKLLPKLRGEELETLYELETDLIRVYIKMTGRGIPVDEEKLEKTIKYVEGQSIELQQALNKRVGFEINTMASDHLVRAFEKEDVWFPRTAKGNPSFQKAWLEGHEHWLPKSITSVRTSTRFLSVFLRGHIQGSLHKGRIHSHIHGLRADDGGAVTGRLSYSNPPLQQTPSRDEELAPLIRGVFLPEEGLWGSYDYKQQEPYLVVHYAALLGVRGGREAAEWLNTADNPDFHQMFADLVERKREKTTKDMYQGISYGIGDAKLAATLNVSEEKAAEYKALVREKVPFLEGLAEMCSRRAADVGFIRTIARRRGRFPFWEPAEWGLRTGEKLREPEARARWPGQHLVRYKLHKAMNKLIQGGAADQMKRAMLEVDKAGYDISIQMHDEMGVSTTSKKQVDEIVEIMRDSVKLLVPVGVDAEFGHTWGTAKKTWEEANASDEHPTVPDQG
jgi:DNA polymerase-1